MAETVNHPTSSTTNRTGVGAGLDQQCCAFGLGCAHCGDVADGEHHCEDSDGGEVDLRADEVAEGGVQIRDHHQRAIEHLADAFCDDPEFCGIIIGGSVAKGYAREDSDVDFMIIATDEAFERRLAARDLFITAETSVTTTAVSSTARSSTWRTSETSPKKETNHPAPHSRAPSLPTLTTPTSMP